MTSDIARKALLFVFYGYYRCVTKDSKKRTTTKIKPIYDWIHRKTSNGRSRYVTGLKVNFKKFISLYNMPSNKHWRSLLTDGGEGEAPMEYLVAFEEGLRNYSTDVHTLGTHPLRTPCYWGKVDQWRKREAYIALARFLLEMKADYRQWDCFLFADYTSRQKMARTFNKRHFPLSDGNDDENFDGELQFDWAAHEYYPRKKRKITLPRKHSVTVPANNSPASVVNEPQVVMVYDVERDCLVPL